MNQPHPVGVTRIDRENTEGVSPGFNAAFIRRAQEKTIAVTEEIRHAIREGMSELEARKLALEVFAKHGVKKHWHQPYIRFGAGTTLTFHEPLQSDYRLKSGDAFYVDLGPVWADTEKGLEYEGDYGDTFVMGKNPEAEKCAEIARALFDEGRTKWKNGSSGEDIYCHLKKRAEQLGYVLVEKVDGHRVGDFPHQKFSRERLAKLPFSPAESLWVLEVQINDPQGRFGAFFEDLL